MGRTVSRGVTLARYFLIIISFVVAACLLIGRSFSSDVEAQDAASVPGSPYQSIDKSAGVWNDGQAALWDLTISDHFMIFGPKERVRGHKPEQPIKFSHVTHVQKNQMECQFCHWSVAKSEFAAIPETETCYGCHKWVKGTEQWQQEEIAKIERDYTGMVETSPGVSVRVATKPIPWVKVHVMPDHVRFNHKRHVKAGVSCQSCHGQVPTMEVVERVSSMKMGWCVSCHRAQGTSIDCNTCHH